MKEITLRIFDDSDFGRLGAMMIEGNLWLVARDVAKAMGFGTRRKGITDGVDGGLSVFENTEFGRVRTIALDEKPWFVGKDVAEILGYSNATDAIRYHVDDKDRMGSKNSTPSDEAGVGILPPSIIDSMGREQFPVWINESGVYSLIMGSKLPDAQEFKHWVTAEILPSIMRHGEYQTPALQTQQEAVEQYVAEKHRKHLSRIDLREGLTKGLHQEGANKNPAAYIAAKEQGTLTKRVDCAVDKMMAEFGPSGVTIVDLDGVKELSLQAPAGDMKAYLVWVNEEVDGALKAAIGTQSESVKRLPESERKMLQLRANKLAGDEKRKATNSAKKECDGWSGSQTLTALCRRVASREFQGDMKHGCNLVFKIIGDELGIDFGERGLEWLAANNKKPAEKRPSRAQLVRPEEMDAALQAVARYCGYREIDVADILQKYYDSDSEEGKRQNEDH